MTSAVEICNLALANVGSTSRIDSLTEASKEAAVCRQYYEHCRDIALSAHNWGFARKVAALAETANTPLDTKWAVEYAYPSDCVKIRKILPEASEPNEYERGISEDDAAVIWCNVDEAYADYTKAITDTSFFSVEFVWALAWNLAAAIAMKVTGDANKKTMAEQKYQLAIQSARATDFSEQHITREIDSEFTRARY